MSCSCSKFDIDEGFKCSITGDRCVFMFPNEKACYELYGEGPYADEGNGEGKVEVSNLEEAN
ncbi:TPA: hypothetical protein R9N60_001704 [Clostridium perfringens]|nr:hypothetical protein [Clostridium perfringens]MDU1212690.1 hypothetical protein [Clostridium perfringens]HEE9818850.1 hypothetical protein [Clostridium perfringens]